MQEGIGGVKASRMVHLARVKQPAIAPLEKSSYYYREV